MLNYMSLELLSPLKISRKYRNRIEVNNRKYSLPRAKIENYNVLINGRNFYD